MALKRMGAPDKFKVIKEKWVVQGKLLIFSGGLEIHPSLMVLPVALLELLMFSL